MYPNFMHIRAFDFNIRAMTTIIVINIFCLIFVYIIYELLVAFAWLAVSFCAIRKLRLI